MNFKLSRDTLCSRAVVGKVKNPAPINEPIINSAIFKYPDTDALSAGLYHGSTEVYQRFGNPTTSAAAEKIAELEGAEAALVFSSGMAAITTTLLALLTSGDHLVIQREAFSHTILFVERVLGRSGVQYSSVDATKLDDVKNTVKKNTKLIYIDSPSNPLLRIADIRELSEIARASSALLVVDSTFATPYLQNPLELGASLVVHAATKFLSGHHDILCGAVAGNVSLMRRVGEMQLLLGGVLDPNAAAMLLRSIKTLPVRVNRQSESALALAEFLATKRDIVRRVRYPWLRESEEFSIAQHQMRAGGGVLSFEFNNIREAQIFVNSLELISIATSLGGVESIIEIPHEMNFNERHMGEAAKQTGIPEGLVRLSVGLEDVSDLKTDIDNALQCVLSHRQE